MDHAKIIAKLKQERTLSIQRRQEASEEKEVYYWAGVSQGYSVAMNIIRQEHYKKSENAQTVGVNA